VRVAAQFPVARATLYYADADGLDGTEGVIRLNWQLGSPPTTRTNPPYEPSLRQGDPISIQVPENRETIPPPRYQWLLEFTPLAGETNRTLGIGNYAQMNAGTYRLVEDNFAGAVTSVVARLPFLLELVRPRFSVGGFQTAVRGRSGQHAFLQSSPDFMHWSTVSNLLVGPTNVWIEDRRAFSFPVQFYRLQEP